MTASGDTLSDQQGDKKVGLILLLPGEGRRLVCVCSHPDTQNWHMFMSLGQALCQYPAIPYSCIRITSQMYTDCQRGGLSLRGTPCQPVFFLFPSLEIYGK